MMTEAAVGSLVVAGIYLTARVASFIFGELTEEERQKQDAIRQKNQQFPLLIQLLNLSIHPSTEQQ